MADATTRPLRIVGLDLSLTSTGLSDGSDTFTVTTSADDPLEQRLASIDHQVWTFVTGIRADEADLVVIEGAAFGAVGNAVDQLAALRMLVRVRLWRAGVPFAMVSPATLKAYTTGNGKATKAQMVAALSERHGLDLSRVRITHGKYDQADAYALAAMGYQWAGQSLPTAGPPPRMASLMAARWPDRSEVRAAPATEGNPS